MIRRACHFLCGSALLLTVTQQVGAADCVDASAVYGATFEVTSDTREAPREITVLRQMPGRVMYVMEGDHLTRVYENFKNGRAAVLEYFDLENIGVEYEPAPYEWDALYEFFPVSRLTDIPQTGTGEFHCLETVTHAGPDGEGSLKVSYLKDLRFPVLVEQASPRGSQQWQLTQLHTDRQLLASHLARVETYTTYDFADLGDSENEPFFRNSEYLKYKVHGGEGGHDHGHGHAH